MGRSASEYARRSVVAGAEMAAGLSHASAEAFRPLSPAMASGSVESSGLGRSVLDGLVKGQVNFIVEAFTTLRRVLDAFTGGGGPRPAAPVGAVREAGTRPDVVAQLDYDRLAALVAAEMKKRPAARPG